MSPEERPTTEAAPAQDDSSRLVLLRVVLVIAALATLLYTAPLWRSHELPPQVPPFPLSPPLWIDATLFLVALAALVTLIVGGRSAALAVATFLVAMLVLLLGDQHRWQPEMQMFVIFAVGLGVAAAVPAGRVGALTVLRWYVVSIYAYSGLQKLNPSFVLDVAPWLTRPLLDWSGIAARVEGDEVWTAIGIAMALTEASLALLLVLPRTRAVGVVMAVLMHAFVLLSIGPLGHRWNEVVWPWNAFMVVAVPALFWRAKGNWLAHLEARPLATAMVVLIALYPAGFSFGIIDAYPAHNLYSGYPGTVTVCVPREMRLSDEWRTHVQTPRTIAGRAWSCIDDLGWHLEAGGVPPFIAPRVQAALGAAICADLPSADILLIETGRASLLRFGRESLPRRSETTHGCEAVLARANAGLLGGSPR